MRITDANLNFKLHANNFYQRHPQNRSNLNNTNTLISNHTQAKHNQYPSTV